MLLYYLTEENYNLIKSYLHKERCKASGNDYCSAPVSEYIMGWMHGYGLIWRGWRGNDRKFACENKENIEKFEKKLMMIGLVS